MLKGILFISKLLLKGMFEAERQSGDNPHSSPGYSFL